MCCVVQSGHERIMQPLNHMIAATGGLQAGCVGWRLQQCLRLQHLQAILSISWCLYSTTLELMSIHGRHRQAVSPSGMAEMPVTVRNGTKMTVEGRDTRQQAFCIFAGTVNGLQLGYLLLTRLIQLDSVNLYVAHPTG